MSNCHLKNLVHIFATTCSEAVGHVWDKIVISKQCHILHSNAEELHNIPLQCEF